MSLGKDIVCADDENNLYFATQNSRIVKYSASGEAEVLYSTSSEKELYSLIYDGEYIYFYEDGNRSGAIVRIDKQGQTKEKIIISVNNEFCKEHKISGDLYTEVTICGVDAQNIVISTRQQYLKGLENVNRPSPYDTEIKTNAVGIISKKAFDDPNESIKSIYMYK